MLKGKVKYSLNRKNKYRNIFGYEIVIGIVKLGIKNILINMVRY